MNKAMEIDMKKSQHPIVMPFNVFVLRILLVMFCSALPLMLGAQYTRYTSPDSRYNILYLDKWDIIDVMHPGLISDSLRAFYGESLDTMLDINATAKVDIAFLKLTGSTANGLNIIVNKEKAGSPKDSDIEDMRKQMPDYFRDNLGVEVKDVDINQRKVGKYKCIVMKYSIAAPDPDITLVLNQYLFDTSQRSFILTFTSTDEEYPTLSKHYDDIVASLQDTSPKFFLSMIPKWLRYALVGAVIGGLSSLFRSSGKSAPETSVITPDQTPIIKDEDVDEEDEEEEEHSKDI